MNWVFMSQKTFFIVTAEKTSDLINTNKIKINPNLKNGVFWVVTPCGFCKNRRFGGTWRLLQEPHGVTTQETPFFIVTAVKTSNLT
jgi:hypothetical protein